MKYRPHCLRKAPCFSREFVHFWKGFDMGRKHHQSAYNAFLDDRQWLEPLSRHQAIEEVCRCLQHFVSASPTMQRRVMKWITLFNLDAEELLEAGLDYETLRAVERRFLF
jgi:hypothetical protein